MLPGPRGKRQPPLLWPGNAEPPAPPWIWMVPSAAGLLRIGGAGAGPPPLLLAAPHPPQPAPVLQGVPAWQLPCEPLLPLLAVPSAPEQQHPLLSGQWMFGSHSPVIGFSPSSSVEFVPIFPHVYTSTVPPHAGKSWIDKRLPNCKIYLNNAFALDSAWIHPEESRIFQGHEKPLLMTNQVAMAISRPATASRPLPTVVLTPQPIPGGCQNSLKQVGSNQTIALAAAAAAAAAAMVSVDSEAPQGPSPTSIQPCHVLTVSPIKIPVLTSPFPGAASRMDAHMTPLMPTQVTRVTAVSTPAVTFMATNLVDQTLTDNGKESKRASCPRTLILHSDRKTKPTENDDNKDHSLKLVNEDDRTSNGNKPVASTPVPGSPWCVVWTGDDRVFFFNPTMQLSVWEKPVDLKNRGDINRIIEDPPHKRKLETSANKSDSSCPEDVNDEHSTKIKRNKTEDSQNADQEKVEVEEKNVKTSAHQIVLPLEERITHFRDMLLERGVSAFSTWEKELHKIVFDPRYLLLNSEERKQIFEQFVKTRMKEEYKERKNKLLLAKEEFKKLLEESKLSPRTTFKEFAEKHGRDQRFRLVQKKKDQEHFFNQFILILKKRDKENRIRLRKMR
ncbi:transcription elongation regulator 1-like protein isoform X2 [Alligator mississippiensis]|uniref:transcription elongation regulator 1-like protein isoform X2 n=1 Tax=Alligator mississippiensis TaxID=8496 RepID=UPI000906F75D|nr:transcription elongation regulator 1-like protein isoform X2 [Alligator mississippiensis]